MGKNTGHGFCVFQDGRPAEHWIHMGNDIAGVCEPHYTELASHDLSPETILALERYHKVYKHSSDEIEIPDDSRQELTHFWNQHPDLRSECKKKYGFDPVNDETDYWRHGLADEPEHHELLDQIRNSDNIFSLDFAKRWEHQELAAAQKEHPGHTARKPY